MSSYVSGQWGEGGVDRLALCQKRIFSFVSSPLGEGSTCQCFPSKTLIMQRKRVISYKPFRSVGNHCASCRLISCSNGLLVPKFVSSRVRCPRTRVVKVCKERLLS